MKFGKVDDISKIDFSLPEDGPHSDELSPDLDHPVHFYVGATGWSMKEWKGGIYPPKAKAGDFLNHYAQHFNSIELNSTHYTLPKIETIQKWKDQVPDDFRFCPKVWQLISHRKDLGIQSGNLTAFIDRIVLFEDLLGPSFLQLPPYFSFERIELLELLLNKWSSSIPLAIEARHASFYEEGNFSKYLSLCIKHKCIPLITDVAGRRDILHSSLAVDQAMIRWVGNDLHASDYSRLNSWVKRIETWKEKGINEIYFFPHEPGMFFN